MASNDPSKVVEIYAAYLEDVNHLRATRTAIDNSFVTIATFLLAGAGYVASKFLLPPQVLTLGSWRPENLVACAGVVAISYIGIRFCKLWHKISEDNRKSIAFKFKNLENMERDHVELKDAGASLFLQEYRDRHPEPKSAPQESASESAAKALSGIQAAANSGIEKNRNKERPNKKSNRGVSSGVGNIQALFEEVIRLFLWGAIAIKVVAIIVISFVVPALSNLSLPHW